MRHQTLPVSDTQKRCMTLRLCTLQERIRLTAFDRVVMDVIDMSTEIIIVTNQMLPIASLPDTSLPAGDAPFASPFIPGQTTRETCLDLCPAIGIVGITGRQTPHAMQVIGQHHDRQHIERPSRLRRPERGTQIVHPLHQQPATALQQIDGEETGAAGHTDATIVRHPRSVAPTPADHHQQTPGIGVRKPSGLSRLACRRLRHWRAQGPPYEKFCSGA